jgi:hypothetical protein
LSPEGDLPLLLLPLFSLAIGFSLVHQQSVIPTEAAHSLIVSGAVEGPPHFAFAVAVALVVAF